MAPDILPEQLQLESISSYVVAVLIVGLLVAFLVYVIEKELQPPAVVQSAGRRAGSVRGALEPTVGDLGSVGGRQSDQHDSRPEDVLNMILSSALELLGGTEGSIMLLDEDGEYLEVVSYHGPNRRDGDESGRSPRSGRGSPGRSRNGANRC